MYEFSVLHLMELTLIGRNIFIRMFMVSWARLKEFSAGHILSTHQFYSHVFWSLSINKKKITLPRPIPKIISRKNLFLRLVFFFSFFPLIALILSQFTIFTGNAFLLRAYFDFSWLSSCFLSAKETCVVCSL